MSDIIKINDNDVILNTDQVKDDNHDVKLKKTRKVRKPREKKERAMSDTEQELNKNRKINSSMSLLDYILMTITDFPDDEKNIIKNILNGSCD